MFTFLCVAALTLLIAATAHIVALSYQRAVRSRPSASVSSVQRFVWRVFAVCLLLWERWREQLIAILAVWTMRVITSPRGQGSILALLGHTHVPHRAFPLSCCLLD